MQKEKRIILKELLKKHGLSQKDLAEKLIQEKYKRASNDYVSKWIRGFQELKIEDIEAIAKVLNEDISAFFPCESSKKYESSKKIESLFIKVEREINCGKAPLKTINALNIPLAKEEYKESLKAVKARGNLMSPVIDEGDIVIYDNKAKITHGDLVIYRLYDEEACKVYIHKKDINIIELKPIEKDENFKTLSIRADDRYIMQKLEMFKVVKIIKNLQNNYHLLKLLKED